MTDDIEVAIKNYDYESKMQVVSNERIQDELTKCFKFDTLKTILMLNEFPELRDYVFNHTKMWLKPSFQK